MTDVSTHIFPSHLVGYVVGCGKTIRLENGNAFWNTLAIHAERHQNVVVWTSFLKDELEGFTNYVCSHYESLPKQWKCINTPLNSQFDEIGFQAACALIRDHGGHVDVIHETANWTLRPIFERHESRVVENCFSYPVLNNWEDEQPHRSTRMHWSGLPMFCSPGLPVLLCNLLTHYRFDHAVDFGAYKFGITSSIAQLSHHCGTKVVAVNDCDLNDEPWLKYLHNHPWASNVQRVQWRPESGHAIELPYTDGSVFAFINWHYKPWIEAAVKTVLDNFPSGVFLFHATNHLDMPAFVDEFAMKDGVSEISLSYNPPDGLWCDSGLFEFNFGER